MWDHSFMQESLLSNYHVVGWFTVNEVVILNSKKHIISNLYIKNYHWWYTIWIIINTNVLPGYHRKEESNASHLLINTIERTSEFSILLFLLPTTYVTHSVWWGVVRDANSTRRSWAYQLGSVLFFFNFLPYPRDCYFKFIWQRVLMTFS